MRSLWTIAELAWRSINPPGKSTARNTLEEYVETAKDEFAHIAFVAWLELRNFEDTTLIDSLLVRKKYDVKEGPEGLYSDLDVEVMDLPKDLGVLHVVPTGCQPLTKGQHYTANLFKNDPGERSYYRIGKQIFYPDGFDKPQVKSAMITTVSLSTVDGKKLMIPDQFAKAVSDALYQKYGGTRGIPADETNNKNPNR